MEAPQRTGEIAAAAPQAAGLSALARRLRQGDASSLPVLLGLVLIWGIFASQNENFLSARNLTNLVLQIAAMGTISVGIVLVLLLGEIDLSVGAVSGMSAAVMAILNVQHEVSPVLSLLAGVATGSLIGLLQGFWFTRFRVPSFVVTLAGLLAWQGALLWVLGTTGTVNVYDPLISGLAGTFLSPLLGWALGALCVGMAVFGQVVTLRRRTRAGLPPGSRGAMVARVAIVAVLVPAVVGLLNADRGVPLALLLLLGFVIGFDLLLRRTRFGRHVFAVGGNAEAARRAGIRVDVIRVAVFTLCGALAAAGGMLATSRLLAVNQSSGGGDVLLNAIAAAVIGGTSLFGGRGTVWSALTGALLIGSISNGMDLLALPSSVKFMVTGAALLAAVTIDALARSGRQQPAGRS
ncbi:ABC transporter permease [Sorangium cellulosum]|uniref:Xylose transport system permease protein XylH n=1 Tax=Sorangium cellulosum TaxID=56 RepID=A0A2L0EHE4_SORCE|nr:ABC transporter permease [Sorangium cellulosum]AUX38707.1 ABC transporter permease [Sorangium cellulosum]